MQQLFIVGGALRYEFRMQLRRRSVWVVLGLLGALIFLLWYAIASDALNGHYSRELHAYVPPSQSDAILGWAQFLAMFLPVGVGLVLADRLARDRQMHVDEMFDALPGSLGARLVGKWLGSTLATLVPVLALYAAVIIYVLAKLPNAQGIPLALGAFALILLPGILFVAGFSVACPAVLKVPVYQFLFIGYWFWANLMSPKIGIPSIVGTMLNAAGPWAQEGIFHFQWTFLTLHVTALQGYESVAVLTTLGLVAVVAAWAYLRWREAQR